MELPSTVSDYESLSPWERIERLFSEFEDDEILITSSFGSSSSLLLHMVSRIKPQHPIYFIDTSYSFPETLTYKKIFTEKYDLNVIDIHAKENRQRFTQQNESWKLNQDLCCFINKVEPLNTLKKDHSVWISGLLGYQNANRQGMNIFEPKSSILKFHPLIDMKENEAELYRLIYELPSHPLTNKGYGSIGCTHCTKKGDGRKGRWAETSKSECGLHV